MTSHKIHSKQSAFQSLLPVALIFLIYTAFIYLLYRSSLRVMYGMWGMEDYNYCYLIPVVILYLIWEKRDPLMRTPSRSSWIGLGIGSIGICMYWLGELGGEYYTLSISFWLVFVGLTFMHIGWQKFKIILFPMLLMLSMFPPPQFIYHNLSLQLKLISSRLGVWVLQALGKTAYREGNIIDLGFTQLQVVDACNGLRYLFPLIVLAILVAYFSKSAWWKKIFVVLSAIPISIFVNGLRIASVGLLYPIWGPQVAEGFFHDFSGWAIFMISLGILLAEMWVLNKLFKENGKFKNKDKTPSSKLKAQRENQGSENEKISVGSSELEADSKEETKKTGNRELGNSENQESAFGRGQKAKTEIEKIENLASGKASSSNRQAERERQETSEIRARKLGLFQPKFIVAILLLGATAAIAQTVNFREEVPIAKSFSQFPLRVGEWTGQLQSMDQEFIDQLDLSDYIIVNFRNGSSPSINFYTAYYESQRKGESIHSPSSCLPGSGWEFNQAGRVEVPISGDGRRMTVNRAVMSNVGHKQLSYYWFPMRGRVLTNIWEMKFYNFLDALTQQRTDGALVRLITPIGKDDKIEDADKRLQEFTRELVPVLNTFLPQ
jgi:EpsI family protein